MGLLDRLRRWREKKRLAQKQERLAELSKLLEQQRADLFERRTVMCINCGKARVWFVRHGEELSTRNRSYCGDKCRKAYKREMLDAELRFGDLPGRPSFERTPIPKAAEQAAEPSPEPGPDVDAPEPVSAHTGAHKPSGEPNRAKLGRPPTTGKITKACDRCGKPVTRYPSRMHDKVYCNMLCAKPPTPASTCGGCGEEFVRPGGGKFCSRPCYFAWRRLNPKPPKRYEYTCCNMFCGKQFLRTQVSRNKRQFCSRDCFFEWQKGSTHRSTTGKFK